MFWSIVFNLILIILVIHLCRSAFEYVKISFFHHFLVPIYSLIMFFITMKWTTRDLVLLAILVVVGILIGVLETMQLTFRKKPAKHHHKKEGEEKANHSKWVYEMRRGWPYLVGWILVIVIGLALSDIINHSGLYHLFVDKVFEEIFSEIDPLSFLTESHPWYIWALSSVSSLAFAWRGTHLLRHQEAAHTIPILEEEPKNKVA